MESLSGALVMDAGGAMTDRHRLIVTHDFDELEVFTRRVYMPYRVHPGARCLAPDADLHAVSIGQMTLSRFSYGIPVHLSDFFQQAGMGMVLTTIRGAARHWSSARTAVETGVGESFLVDTSRTDYQASFNEDHLQVNVTFPHDCLERLYLRWAGHPADARLWATKLAIGGRTSAWNALLEYCCRCVAEFPRQVAEGPLGRHLEEMLGMHMLMEWSARAGVPPHPSTPAPRQVLQAEHYMREHARQAPTVGEVAQAVGVSARGLSSAFRHFRSTTPMAFLREVRLDGVRRALIAAPDGATVASIAEQWGYANLGAFAARFRARFGEYPSALLRSSLR